MKPNHKNGPSQMKDFDSLSRSEGRVYGVVLLEPSTCLNNCSITPETSEGTPHRGGNKGHDPGVKSVTREDWHAH